MIIFDFFRASTIHGLAYLADAKSAFAKILWLVCVISASLTAAVIIYFNVTDWANSPTVVTSVKPALVEVRK